MLLATQVRARRLAWRAGDVLTDRLAVLEADPESGQVGSMVLIGILVIIAVVAGRLIFNAVSKSAHTTANCISNPGSCANNAP